MKSIDLSWNCIRENDVRPFCNALKVEKSIFFVFFAMKKNFAIFSAKKNFSLEKIDFSMNGLENQGAQLLSSVLPKNKTLRELDLSNNRIEKDGASIFAANLEKSRSLKKLSVGEKRFSFVLKIVFVQFGENPIGTLGSLVLLKAIDHSQSQVEFLDLKVIFDQRNFPFQRVHFLLSRIFLSMTIFTISVHKSISIYDLYKWFMVEYEEN